MSTATSASERIEAAKKALEAWDADTMESYGDTVDLAVALEHALRALIEPPAAEESVEEAAQAYLIKVSNGHWQDWPDGEQEETVADFTAGWHAGLQAALNSWEPDDYAPTLCHKCGGDA